MAGQTSTAAPPVAIVGMAVLLPGAPDLDTYWRNLVDGVDAITDVPAQRWDPGFYDPSAGPSQPDRVYCRRGGFVDGFAEVDAAGFGIMPNSVAGAEPDQLLALRVAAAAIADAGGPERMPDGDRIGVVLGRGGYLTPGIARLDQRVRTVNQLTSTLAELLPGLSTAKLDEVRAAFTDQLGPHSPEAAIGLVPNLAASRIANRLDLRGPAYTVDAACASSLIAVDHAVAELASGRCDAVLAGGVHHCHDITFWSVFCQLGALSHSERIRPFDRNADGILIGEGTGVVVLKRLDDALVAGDRIYAVVRGTGVASDGRAASLFNPEPAGQVLALRRAWQAAGLDPRDPHSVGLVEAHGTATVAGDGAELTTLAEVFGPGSPAVIGSVKSMIGHTMPAAGVAGLVKAALALHRQVLLPTLHCDDPNPLLEQTRFRPIATAQPWEEGPQPRRAAVNAFGFGGINAHVVLEQAPAAASGRRSRAAARADEPERVLRLAAADVDALAARLAAGAATDAETGSGPCRLAIVDPTQKKLALAERIVANGKPWRGRSDIWFSPEPLLRDGRVAFVFPGLEADFAPRIDDVVAHFGLTDPGSSHAVGDIGRHGLRVVEVARVLEAALARVGVHPDAICGYSVGEWSAMISSGMYATEQVDAFLADFDPDSLEVPGLVFAAVGAGAGSPKVRAALDAVPGIALSHDNSPNQCVLCGPQERVTELVRVLRAGNVLCQELPFRSGFHTPMLEPFLGPIREAAEKFALHPTPVPVWSATTVAPFPANEAEVRAIFLRHLVEPVRFRELVEAMYADGVRAFVQVGTGQLASVIGDVLHGRDHLAIAANAPVRSGLAQLRRVVAALWVDGADVDVDALALHLPQVQHSKRAPMRLDLGGPLVRLGSAVAPLALDAAVPGEVTTLERLGAQVPAAGELAALLRETAAGAVALLQAVPPTVQAPPAPQAPPPLAATTSTLHVSVERMPYLVDHCFFKQRTDWPELADRWPVVPATTIVAHAMAAAEAAAQASAPGCRAVEVRQARFSRWIAAIPPVDVPVTVTPVDAAQVQVRLGDYAQATVVLDAAYPPAPSPAQAPHGSRALESPITAAQLYGERWMFHGPQFQAVTDLVELGERHVRATLTAPSAPGALLDNVGQVLGFWIMATHETRKLVFPVGMERISFHGDAPPPGTQLDCRITITAVTDTELVADAQLLVDGRVWVDIGGWVDRRFDSHPQTWPVERAPDQHTLSVVQPGGWVLLHERWPDLASRELFMRNHLSAPERAEYDTVAPRQRRAFLLGRIAVKDAVRHRLWDAGAGPLFPAEVRVGNDEAGRPLVSGHHTQAVPPLAVSLAHSAEVGVAIVRPSGTRVGIDVAEVADRPQSTVDFALGDDEAALLDAVTGRDAAAKARWFTAFFAAKEAVAKAEGTGLRGNPKRFRISAADADDLTVTVDGQDYRVHTTVTGNPDDLPERTYVVAWTELPVQRADTIERDRP